MLEFGMNYQAVEPSMAEFEVYYQEDEPRGWPGGWRLRGTFARTHTAQAVEAFLEGAPGIYLVTFVGGGPANAKFWLKKKDGIIELYWTREPQGLRQRTVPAGDRCFAWKAVLRREILRGRCQRRTLSLCGEPTRRSRGERDPGDVHPEIEFHADPRSPGVGAPGKQAAQEYIEPVWEHRKSGSTQTNLEAGDQACRDHTALGAEAGSTGNDAHLARTTRREGARGAASVTERKKPSKPLGCRSRSGHLGVFAAVLFAVTTASYSFAARRSAPIPVKGECVYRVIGRLLTLGGMRLEPPKRKDLVMRRLIVVSLLSARRRRVCGRSGGRRIKPERPRPTERQLRGPHNHRDAQRFHQGRLRERAGPLRRRPAPQR